MQHPIRRRSQSTLIPSSVAFPGPHFQASELSPDKNLPIIRRGLYSPVSSSTLSHLSQGYYAPALAATHALSQLPTHPQKLGVCTVLPLCRTPRGHWGRGTGRIPPHSHTEQFRTRRPSVHTHSHLQSKGQQWAAGACLCMGSLCTVCGMKLPCSRETKAARDKLRTVFTLWLNRSLAGALCPALSGFTT